MVSEHKFLSSPKTAAIVGCPFGGGQQKAGIEKAPSHLMNAGLIDQLKELGWVIRFDRHLQFEEVPVEADLPIGMLKNPRLVSHTSRAVVDAVGAHTHNGKLSITIRGNHSLAMGMILGTLSHYPDTCVIWVDAHTDINNFASTTSGNIHGMPLSFLLGL
ncbi:hypothetical protein M0805_007833, partial [Coniferiporia weirii]